MSSLRRILDKSFIFKVYCGKTLRTGEIKTVPGCRNLYSKALLAIDTYERERERYKSQYHGVSSSFKSKMMQFVDEERKQMIFSDDLKTMIHIMEPTEEDLQLLRCLMRVFNMQSNEIRFGSFVFGPVIMRTYHYFNLPQEALDVFRDEELTTFFQQFKSYQVLMDMLYENKMYAEVNEVFVTADSYVSSSGMEKYPQAILFLYLAALYKVNSQESLKASVDALHRIADKGNELNRRCITIASLLAINQGAPHIAFEILSLCKNHDYMTIRNIKVIALAGLGRLEEALQILRNTLLEGAAGAQYHSPSDVVAKVRNAMTSSPDKELFAEFERIENQLRLHKKIDDSKTLEEILLSEVQPSLRYGTQRERHQMTRRDNHRPGPDYRRPGPDYRRPSLDEMY